MFPISDGFLLLEHCAETKGRREEVAGAKGRHAAWRLGNRPAGMKVLSRKRKKENFALVFTPCLPKYQITMIKK